MKKIFSILVAAAALCAVACTNKGTEEASLSVDPKSIEFPAENATATDVTVTAVGVKWEISVAETASGWLTAEKVNDKTITVTATDNTTSDQRVGSVIITSDDKVVGNREITVVQAGSENPVAYDLQLSSSLLEFEPESAEAQTVTVTVSGEMGWKAEAAEGCAEWVTVTAAADSFTVKVGDNPDTKERIGTVVVTADNESVEPKEVTIKQKPKVLPPSLKSDTEELSFNFMDRNTPTINITAINCKWTADTEDENGERAEWIHITNMMPDISAIVIAVDNNEEFTERVAYIVISSDTENVEDVRIKITQAAALEHLSELTDNIDLTPALKNAYVMCNPLNDWESDDAACFIELRFWGDGIEFSTQKYPPYSGTGEYIQIDLNADRMVFNDDKEYEIASGEYKVQPYSSPAQQFTINAGSVAEWDSSQLFDSWYRRIEDDGIVCKAPISKGTMTVERNGEDYVITLEFEDDLGFTMTGTYEGPLTVLSQGVPADPPITA